MVNHGLISATLFLLAGMVERRTTTGELGRIGGMARGRPALATMLLATGIIALAVPFSSAFAGEFLILAGVFQQGWGWAVVGAVAMVLAAMYMLRLISAVLHQDVAPAVSSAALDLRPAELGIVVPSSAGRRSSAAEETAGATSWWRTAEISRSMYIAASTIATAPTTAQPQPCWKTPARIRNSPANADENGTA